MEDYPEPEGGWVTFNEFFARRVDPLKRLIAPDDRVVVSPADCTYGGVWDVNDPGADVTTFDVKGVPWSIGQLLQDELSGHDYGKLFSGGTFTHPFLAPNDYHRQHAPLAGTVVEAKVLPGICYFEVVLDTKNRSPTGRPGLRCTATCAGRKVACSRRTTWATDSPGYQLLQARGLILIDNPIAGLLAVLPIGMAQVSSVQLSVTSGNIVTKGQEISYFALGGSDIVMVFQKRANVKFNQEVGQHYNFGTAVGTIGSVQEPTA